MTLELRPMWVAHAYCVRDETSSNHNSITGTMREARYA